MTKIRNTKKGMAKKTLSISLAVAMLATSNVPVWAAEDLFTDGEVAVEAFTDAEVVEETPVEEVKAPVVEETEVPEAQDAPTVESRYTVEYKKFPTEMEWNQRKEIQIRVFDNVTDEYVTADPNLKFRWLGKDGQLDTVLGEDGTITNVDADTHFATLTLDFSGWINVDPTVLGKQFRLQIYNTADGNATGYAEASAPITLNKVTVTGTANLLGNNGANWNKVEYTGQPIVKGPTLKDGFSAAVNVDYNGVVEGHPLTGTKLVNDDVIKGRDKVDADITNAWNISGDVLTSTVSILDPLYRGSVVIDFAIEPRSLTVDNVDDYLRITLPETSYEYTGATIKVPLADAIVTDVKANKRITDVLTSTIDIGKEIDEYEKVTVALDPTAKNMGNFNFASDLLVSNIYYSFAAGSYNIVKRDLANTASTKIYVKNLIDEKLETSKTVTQGEVLENLVIEDVRTGKDIKKTLGNIKFTVPGAPLTDVVLGKDYPAKVETANTNFVINSRDITFKVVGHDLSDAKVEFEGRLDNPVKYTGSQITKNITKENFATTIGEVRDYKTDAEGKEYLAKLVKDEEYSTTPVFGENLNAYTATNTDVGEGKIIINGAGTYAGTQKEITFQIEKREATKLNVPASVPFDPSLTSAEAYGIPAQTSVTASFKDEWTNEKKTLTVPTTDYEIEEYTYLDENENPVDVPVNGGYIVTTIKVKDDVKSNFDLTENATFKHTAKTKLAKKAIVAENVILNKDTYTYTGKDVDVDYKVAFNGATLEKGIDYEAVVVNGKNVGTGTLVVTGKGEFADSSASVNFKITPAKTSDVKVTPVEDITYDGTKHEPKKSELEITLNGVNVSDDFRVSYPTSRLANINVGDGNIILTPVNKNFDKTGTNKFEIKAAKLEGGTLKAYNEKESLVKWFDAATSSRKELEEFIFKYDGTAKEYTKSIYEAGTLEKDQVVTANDYEIKYVDNVHGVGDYKSSGVGYALVIAKGNYKAEGTHTCEDGTEIKNVVLKKAFLIDRREVHKSNVVIANGTYLGGFDVNPVVSINYNGKKLVENVDFELDYTGLNPNKSRKEVTNGKTLSVRILGKGGYYLDETETFEFNWGIDKFDLANADIIVNGTDANPVVKVMNRSVLVDTKNYDLVVKDGKVTVTATKDNKNYTGTQTVDIKEALVKPGKPVIAGYTVEGNKVTVNLADDVEAAIGYDFVIDTKKDCTDVHKYYQVSKNNLKTSGTFTYVDQDIYYAYCHAYTRDENGKKVFGEWSEPMIISVSAITPETPSIKDVKVKGNTVTVTYTKAADATGYDVVLGSEMATIAGEKRPVKYGELVKKNIKGNTVTATFKNVPAGTYYAGLHAFNRTSEDGKKVFSPWANWSKTVKVK